MTTSIRVIACVYALVLSAPALLAQELMIYPAKGQSAEQQNKDKYECSQWATQQTGINPMQQSAVSSGPEQSRRDDPNAVRGAARGAALGAIGGAIAGDAGKGAAAGAGVGAAAGAMRRRDAEREREAAAQQANQAQAQQRATWDRAVKTCLEGRGYTVN